MYDLGYCYGCEFIGQVVERGNFGTYLFCEKHNVKVHIQKLWCTWYYKEWLGLESEGRCIIGYRRKKNDKKR